MPSRTRLSVVIRPVLSNVQTSRFCTENSIPLECNEWCVDCKGEFHRQFGWDNRHDDHNTIKKKLGSRPFCQTCYEKMSREVMKRSDSKLFAKMQSEEKSTVHTSVPKVWKRRWENKFKSKLNLNASGWGGDHIDHPCKSLYVKYTTACRHITSITKAT